MRRRRFAWHAARRLKSGLVVGLVGLLATGASPRAADHPPSPEAVVREYLRVSYARESAVAYRLISSADQRVRDLNQYLRQRSPFSGFALEVAKRLSGWVEITPLRRRESAARMTLEIRYTVPDPNMLAPLLFSWDPHRLNSLAATERRELIALLDEKKRAGSLAMRSGEQTIELVREEGRWRVFLNWAAGVKIPLRLDFSKSAGLEVSVSPREFELQPGVPFEIRLKIKNRSAKPLTARIGHLVEPEGMADFLEFVQCGFLLPVTIAPTSEQEYAGTYLLRATLPEGVRQLILTYDFRLLK